MSENKDSKKLDKSVLLPSSGVFSSHTHQTSVQIKALQSSVREQKQMRDNDMIKNNDFDADTEDELSSKKPTTAENKTTFLEETSSGIFDIDTKDESSKCKKSIRMINIVSMRIWKILIRNRKIRNI